MSTAELDHNLTDVSTMKVDILRLPPGQRAGGGLGSWTIGSPAGTRTGG
jgi:hypothetical protein